MNRLFVMSTQRVHPFYRDLHLLSEMTFRETCNDFLSTGTFSPSKHNGSHRSGMICVLLWVGWLVGNYLLVELLLLLVVVQLLNPILSSYHVSKRSWEEAEVTHVLSLF